MADFNRTPKDETLGEFMQWQELLQETGRQIIALDDVLTEATQRESAREARRQAIATDLDKIRKG